MNGDVFDKVLAIRFETQQDTAELAELCEDIARWVDQGLELRASIDRCRAKIVRGERIDALIEEHGGEDDDSWWKHGPRDGHDDE